MALRSETLLKDLVQHHSGKTPSGPDDRFPKFVEKYIVDGHRNIIIAGAIMAHVVRQWNYESSGHMVQHQVPHALGGLALFCATLSIYTSLAFMNRLRCRRSSSTFAARWSQDAGIWRSYTGYTITNLLRMPFWWTAWAAMFAVSYCVTRKVFPAVEFEAKGLDTAMRLDLKLGVAVFMVGAVTYSLVVFRAFVRIGARDAGS